MILTRRIWKNKAAYACPVAPAVETEET